VGRLEQRELYGGGCGDGRMAAPGGGPAAGPADARQADEAAEGVAEEDQDELAAVGPLGCGDGGGVSSAPTASRGYRACGGSPSSPGPSRPSGPLLVRSTVQDQRRDEGWTVRAGVVPEPQRRHPR
jgi:hypothetical protein